MEIISFETAKRLKEAGFSQPETEHLQLWTDRRYPDGTARHDALLVVNKAGTFTPFDGGNQVDIRNPVFMPTSTDILKEMPNDWVLLHRTNGDFCVCCPFLDDWNEPIDPAEFINENPAEACAAAWLHLNENKNEKPDTVVTSPISNAVVGSVKNKWDLPEIRDTNNTES